MNPPTRMTMPTKAVLAALLPGRSYGLRIARDLKLRVGTVYEILARLERAGLAASTPEDRAGPAEPRDTGAPRRYWDLTPEGRAVAGRTGGQMTAPWLEYVPGPARGSRLRGSCLRCGRGVPVCKDGTVQAHLPGPGYDGPARPGGYCAGSHEPARSGRPEHP